MIFHTANAWEEEGGRLVKLYACHLPYIDMNLDKVRPHTIRDDIFILKKIQPDDLWCLWFVSPVVPVEDALCGQ